MKPTVIIDTGPIVAFLSSRDAHHTWAVEQFAQLEPPLVTCEAVLSEACFLLRAFENGPSAVLALVDRGVCQLPLLLQEEATAVRRLLVRYRTVPMSLADACLVRLAELRADSRVMTLDRHFSIYRRLGRQVIPLISPTRK